MLDEFSCVARLKANKRKNIKSPKNRKQWRRTHSKLTKKTISDSYSLGASGCYVCLEEYKKKYETRSQIRSLDAI